MFTHTHRQGGGKQKTPGVSDDVINYPAIVAICDHIDHDRRHHHHHYTFVVVVVVVVVVFLRLFLSDSV